MVVVDQIIVMIDIEVKVGVVEVVVGVVEVKLVVVLVVVVLVVQLVVVIVLSLVVVLLVVVKLLVEKGLLMGDVVGLGCDGCVMKGDVLVVGSVLKVVLVVVLVKIVVVKLLLLEVKVLVLVVMWLNDCLEQCVLMLCLCVCIVECLFELQQINVILMMFNEVNMVLVMELCNKYKDKFEKEYGVKFGFMLFFVKVVVYVLKKFLFVNVLIDGNDIVYYGYFDIGIVVGLLCGLVVLILCNVD